jgi:hypothetical protein
MISAQEYHGYLHAVAKVLITGELMTSDGKRPPLRSSGQSSWLQIQMSGFDFRCYQIFCEVVGLKRGPLSLMSTIEELKE